jgi:hypothetical protein
MEIPRDDYRKRLTAALARRAQFPTELESAALDEVLNASPT